MAWSTPPGLKIVEMEADLERSQNELAECKQLREEEAKLHFQDATTIANLKLQLSMLGEPQKGSEDPQAINLGEGMPPVPKKTDKDLVTDLEKKLRDSAQREKECEEGRKKDATVIRGLKEMIESFKRSQARHGDALKGRDDRITDLEVRLLHCEQKARDHQVGRDGQPQEEHPGTSKQLSWEDRAENERTMRDLQNDRTTYETSIKNLLEEIERLKKDRVGGNDVGNVITSSDDEKDLKIKSLKKELAECKEHSRNHEEQRQIAEGEMNGLKRHVRILEARIAQSPTAPSIDDFDRIRAENLTLTKDKERWMEMYHSSRAREEKLTKSVNESLAPQSNVVSAADPQEGADVEAAVKAEKSTEALQAELQECQNHIEEAEDQIRVLRKHVHDYDETLDAAEKSAKQVQRQLVNCLENKSEAEEQIRRLEDQIGIMNEALEGTVKGAENIESELEESREQRDKAEEQIRRLEDQIEVLDEKLKDAENVELDLEECQKHREEADEEIRKLEDQIDALENNLEATLEGAGHLELELDESQAMNTAREVRRLELKVKEFEDGSPSTRRDTLIKSREAAIQRLEGKLRICQKHVKRQEELLNQIADQEIKSPGLRKQLEEQHNEQERSMTSNSNDPRVAKRRTITRLGDENERLEEIIHELRAETAELNFQLKHLVRATTTADVESRPDFDDADNAIDDLQRKHDGKSVANDKEAKEEPLKSDEKVIPSTISRKRKRSTGTQNEIERREAQQRKDEAEQKRRQQASDRGKRLKDREEKKKEDERQAAEKKAKVPPKTGSKRSRDDYEYVEDQSESGSTDPKRAKM